MTNLHVYMYVMGTFNLLNQNSKLKVVLFYNDIEQLKAQILKPKVFGP